MSSQRSMQLIRRSTGGAIRCSQLQSVAASCSQLQFAAVSCSQLQSVAVCCSQLQSVAVRCSFLPPSHAALRHIRIERATNMHATNMHATYTHGACEPHARHLRKQLRAAAPHLARAAPFHVLGTGGHRGTARIVRLDPPPLPSNARSARVPSIGPVWTARMSRWRCPAGNPKRESRPHIKVRV